jgi:hypothetical protein
MYVVLARKATMTIVCIGCRQAPWERACRRTVAFLFSHEGGAVASVFAAPRKREGRREEASMVGEEKGSVGDRGDADKKGVQEVDGWTFSIKPWTGRGQKWAAGGEEGRDIWSGGEMNQHLELRLRL